MSDRLAGAALASRSFKVAWRLRFGKWRLVKDTDHEYHYERRRFHL